MALPLAARVDASDPLISYTTWSFFGDEEEIGFNWNHTYGPLDWPQEGTEVFVATADGPTYWKTYVLDEFDGDVWSRASDGFGEFGDDYEVGGRVRRACGGPPRVVPDLRRRVERRFRSRLAVTSGTPCGHRRPRSG